MAETEGFVLRAYDTEANARVGGATGRLDINSTANEGGSILNNVSQAAGYHFFTFQRYWYRIEANEPVSEFYIDWDDGEDNSPEKANVSIIKNNKPAFFGVTSHIYTQSKRFYPLIRVKSKEGFLSKWYTPHAGSGSSNLNTFSGLDDNLKNTASTGEVYDSGQNSFSVVSIEKNSKSARATITITDFTELNSGDKVNLVATDGTNYDFTNGDQSSVNGTWESTTSNNATATNLMNVINTSSGPSGTRFTATVSGAVVTVTQAVVGKDGLTTVTLTDSGTAGMTKTDFAFTEGVGVGDFARIPVFEPANVPPVGVLKVDRKRVFSGIDNDRLGNNGRMLDQSSAELSNTSVVHAHCSNAARTGAQVKVTYQEGVTGGVKAVSSIQLKAKGGNAGSGRYNNHDLDDAVIKIKTMDEYYWCFWNVDNRQSDGTGIPGFDANSHTAVIAVPEVENTGGTGAVTTAQLVTSMVNALTAVKFPTTTGRLEFTATGTNDGDTEIITITNNRAGKVAEPVTTHVEVVNGSGSTTPPTVAPFDTTYGNASPANGVNTTTAGVSASDGIIKQATLTTTSSYHANSKLVNVGKVLKAELVNNLENTDSYGGSSGTTTLAAGERIYLISSLHTTAADTAPTTAMREHNPNLSNTICNVSLGSPIVELNSVGTNLTVDATESKVRCSNKSISNYYIDDNKLMSGDTTGNLAAHMADSTYNVTTKMVNGADFKSNYGTKDLRYAFDWWREHQDNNHRFYSQKRLLRCQVEDNHTQATDDGYNRSPLIHYDFLRYEAIGVQAANEQPSEIEKWNYGAFIGTQKAKLRKPQWVDLQDAHLSDRTVAFGPGPTGGNLPITLQLLASTAFDTESTQAHYQPDNVTDAAGLTDSDTVGPRNAFFMAHKVKYDRIFFRVSHDRFNAQQLNPANAAGILNDVTPGTSENWPKIRLQVLYPAKKTKNSSTIVWKPLPITDRTKLQDKDDSTFYRSGEIVFNPPSDWEKTYHAAHNLTSGDTADTNIVYPFEDNFYDDASGSTGIMDVWDHSSYALILVVTDIQSGAGEERIRGVFNIMHAYPYNNSHSQLIEIMDPTHVSLNTYGIAQSVAFVKRGVYQEIKDRSGISQMRRIGAQAGQIKLGSIDLKNDAKSTRVKFDEFVKDAVPVYYDVTHKDDSITRLFGVMTDMSEDHPTAAIIPKFACNMKVTHIVELDSSGNIQGNGYKPLGGDTIDVEQYLSAS